MIVRSYTNNFEIVDRTQEINLIPNQWGIISNSGVFPTSPEGVTTSTVTMEQITQSGAVLVDRIRGERNNYSKDYVRKLYSYSIPHFNIDDILKPEDIQGKTAYGTNDSAEVVAQALARKMERIRRSYGQLKEKIFAQLLADGTVYAPNGTVSTNFYTEFGVSRKEVDFVFGTATTDIIGKIEEGIAHIVDNMQSGDTAQGFIAFCSPGFFSNLIKHAKVQAAYTYYSSTQEPLRNRLNSSLPMGTRTFVHGGVTFVEYRGSDFGGTVFMTANEARLVPIGNADSFGFYAGPANGYMDLVNTIGQENYMFTFTDPRTGAIEIQTEANLLAVARRPGVVVRLYSST